MKSLSRAIAWTHRLALSVEKLGISNSEKKTSDRPGTTKVIYRTLDKFNYNTFMCGESLVLIKGDLPWKLRKMIGFSA